LENANHEKRMRVIQRRDAATFLPIIKMNAVFGNDVFSGEWPGYKKITVNHKEFFVIKVAAPLR
jgi:hypothetical protein